jgi:hypothetical protein
MHIGGPIVYTVPPKVFFHVLMYYRGLELQSNWDVLPDDELMSLLKTVPYCNRALDEDGYAVEEFNEIPSLIENEFDFVGSAREMVEYVGTFL